MHRTETNPDDDDLTLDVLRHELELVQSAVTMVAAGAAPRVQVAGLTFGEQLLDAARRIAALDRVRVVPVWTGDESGAGIVVERIDA